MARTVLLGQRGWHQAVAQGGQRRIRLERSLRHGQAAREDMFRVAWPLHSSKLRPKGFHNRHLKNPLLQRRLKDGELLAKGAPWKQPRRGELISLPADLVRALKLLQCPRYAGHAAAHSVQQHLTVCEAV